MPEVMMNYDGLIFLVGKNWDFNRWDVSPIGKTHHHHSWL